MSRRLQPPSTDRPAPRGPNARTPRETATDDAGRRSLARLVLTTVGLLALVALAGCSAPGSVGLTPVDDGALADEASRSIDGPRAQVDDETARVVREAVVEGAANATGRGQVPPVDERGGSDGEYPYEYRGAFYELSGTVVDQETVHRVEIRADYNASDADLEAAGEPVRLAALPQADRRALDGVVPPRTDRQVDGYELGASATYTDAELAASDLVRAGARRPTERVLVHDGERYLLEVSAPEETIRYTYRYTAEEVAPNEPAYAASLRERYLFELDGLSEPEREVVSTARNGTYYADGGDDEAFASVVDRFRSHDAFHRDEYSGEWIVRWNGQVYWASLRYPEYQSSATHE